MKLKVTVEEPSPMYKSKSRNKRPPKRVLGLPDFEHAKVRQRSSMDPGRSTGQIFTKETRIPIMDPNSHEALLRRREAATLTWRGPALMLFARAACAVGAQAVVAAVFALRASPTPWHDAEPWLPVYGTLIDAGCLALLWRLTRREGIRLFDLVGFERTRLVRDTLLGFALIPVSLVFILGGIYCGRLAFVWDAHAAVPLWAPAIAGRSLWRAGVAVHLGADRADDL